MEGIENGFHLVDADSNPGKVHMDNYKSATKAEVKDKVERQILIEIEEGRYVVVKDEPTIISAIGAIPKDGNDVRIIHDCSKPEGEGLNSFATLTEKQTFQTVEDVARIIQPGWYMAKVDLKGAYRSVKIHQSNHTFTGLRWTFKGHSKPTTLVDTRVPFGSRLGPGIFHRLTQSIRRMMKRRGYQCVVFLDDFLVIAPTYKECLEGQLTLLRLLRELGFYISWQKCEGPTQSIVFLGILIDSVSMTLELPEKKANELISVLDTFKDRCRASKRQLQQLAGKLSFACRVVRGGRCYLRRILDVIATLQRPNHKARLSGEFRKDINWWLAFMSTFNRKSIIIEHSHINNVLVDASNIGSGFAYNHDWGYINWAKDMPKAKQLHINYKEVLSVYFAAARWAPLWANSRVLIHTDSTTAKAILNKGSCRNSYVMKHLRGLFWLSAQFNFTLEALHVPGRLHDLPDAISRLHQPGQLLRMESLLNEQCCYAKFTCPHALLHHHMSHKALRSISPQIGKWLKRR